MTMMFNSVTLGKFFAFPHQRFRKVVIVVVMRYWLVSGNKQCGVNCGRSWSNKISLIPLCRVSSKSAVYVSEIS